MFSVKPTAAVKNNKYQIIVKLFSYTHLDNQFRLEEIVVKTKLSSRKNLVFLKNSFSKSITQILRFCSLMSW